MFLKVSYLKVRISHLTYDTNCSVFKRGIFVLHEIYFIQFELGAEIHLMIYLPSPKVRLYILQPPPPPPSREASRARGTKILLVNRGSGPNSAFFATLSSLGLLRYVCWITKNREINWFYSNPFKIAYLSFFLMNLHSSLIQSPRVTSTHLTMEYMRNRKAAASFNHFDWLAMLKRCGYVRFWHQSCLQWWRQIRKMWHFRFWFYTTQIIHPANLKI